MVRRLSDPKKNKFGIKVRAWTGRVLNRNCVYVTLEGREELVKKANIKINGVAKAVARERREAGAEVIYNLHLPTERFPKLWFEFKKGLA